MKTTRLAIRKIRLDFQPAENLIEPTVEEYLLKLRRGKKLAPVAVRFDGTNYFLYDGFHRLEARKRAGLKTIQATVRPGTLAQMEKEWRINLARIKSHLAKD